MSEGSNLAAASNAANSLSFAPTTLLKAGWLPTPPSPSLLSPPPDERARCGLIV